MIVRLNGYEDTLKIVAQLINQEIPFKVWFLPNPKRIEIQSNDPRFKFYIENMCESEIKKTVTVISSEVYKCL